MTSSRPDPADQRENRIVITGAGAVCPLGNSVEAIRDALLRGEIARRTGDADLLPFRTLRATAPEIRTDVHPRLAKSMGKHLSLLLASADEAYRAAGLEKSAIPAEEIGLFAGMGMVDYRVDDLLPSVLKSLSAEGELDYEKFFTDGYREIYPLWPLAMLNNVAFCQVAIQLGIRGENCVFAPHADAGVQAVAEAVRVLREGKAAAAVAAGVGEEVSALSLARCGLHGLISSARDDERAILGECGAALVLEPIEGAKRRGAQPIAAVSGFGFASETSESETFPTPDAVVRSIEAALTCAGGLRFDGIDLVIAGGRASPEISACTDAVRTICGGEVSCPPVLLPGRIFGEIFSAGPVLNTILGSIILENGQVPSEIPAAFSPYEGRSGKILRILILATSYEGRCASLIVEKV